jgi:hypothetical protein
MNGKVKKLTFVTPTVFATQSLFAGENSWTWSGFVSSVVVSASAGIAIGGVAGMTGMPAGMIAGAATGTVSGAVSGAVGYALTAVFG